MTENRKALQFLVAMTILLSPKIALAWDYKVCLRAPVLNTDSAFKTLTGVIEDYYVTDSVELDYRLRGAMVWIVDPYDQTAFLDYTDLSGCAEFTSSVGGGAFDMAVISTSKTGNNNIIRVHDAGSNTSSEFPGSHYAAVELDLPLYAVDFVPTNTVDFDNIPSADKPIWSMFATASYSIYRLSQGVSNKTINVGHCSSCGSSSSYTGSYGYLGDGTAFIRVRNSQRRWKFLIAHELGHALAWLHDGTADRAVNDFTYSTMWDPCETGGTTYGMYSPEYNNIGFKEGFAHFYATRVFNDRGTSDAAIAWRPSGHWSELVGTPNAPEGSSGYGNSAEYYFGPGTDAYGGFMQNICLASAPTGVSTNYDWLRFYWDFYDDSSCTSTPSFGNMLDIYYRVENQSPSPSKDEFYDAVIDAVFDEFGGSVCHRNVAGIWADYNGIE